LIASMMSLTEDFIIIPVLLGFFLATMASLFVVCSPKVSELHAKVKTMRSSRSMKSMETAELALEGDTVAANPGNAKHEDEQPTSGACEVTQAEDLELPVDASAELHPFAPEHDLSELVLPFPKEVSLGEPEAEPPQVEKLSASRMEEIKRKLEMRLSEVDQREAAQNRQVSEDEREDAALRRSAEVFDALDADHSGGINQVDLSAVDADGDGVVNKAELTELALGPSWEEPEAAPESLAPSHDTISLKELPPPVQVPAIEEEVKTHPVEELPPPVQVPAIEEEVKTHPVEEQAAASSAEPLQRRPSLTDPKKAVFSEMDLNSDGIVTKEEYQIYMKKQLAAKRTSQIASASMPSTSSHSS